MQIRSLIRNLFPYGFVQAHQRQHFLLGLGLNNSAATADAVTNCRYELWPPFLRRNSGKWTLIDVGANEGGFLDAVLKLSKPQKVFAFEPQSSCHLELERLLCQVTDGKLFPAAVGAKDGELDFYCTVDNKLGSLLEPTSEIKDKYKKGAFDVREKAKVPVVQLDSVIPRNCEIDLLKVDVQGAEREVLYGATETLKATRSVLLEMNYVPHYKNSPLFDEMFELMRTNGFRLFGTSAPYCGSDGPLWADAMFVRQT